MRTEATGEHGILVVCLYDVERLDAVSGPRVRQDLVAHLESGNSMTMVIDIGCVERIDSAGLSVFIGLYKLAEGRACRLMVANPTPTVRSMFELTRLHNVLTLVDSVEAAMTAARQPS